MPAKTKTKTPVVSSFDPDPPAEDAVRYVAESGEAMCPACGALEETPGQFGGGMCPPCTTQFEKANGQSHQGHKESAMTEETTATPKTRRNRVKKAIDEALGTTKATKKATAAKEKTPHVPVFKGQEITLTHDEIVAKIAEEAAQDPDGAHNSVTCTVQIGNETVAPKWAVRVITGVPGTEYTTVRAEQLLKTLGFTVERSEKPVKSEASDEKVESETPAETTVETTETETPVEDQPVLAEA